MAGSSNSYPNMHLVIAAEDSERELRSELAASFPGCPISQSKLAGSVELQFPLKPGRRLPYLAFARQLLPDAKSVGAESIGIWARKMFEEVVRSVPEDCPWSLHIEPHYGPTHWHHIGARAWHSLRLQKAQAGPQTSKTPALKSKVPKVDHKAGGTDELRQGQMQPVNREAGRHRCHLIREALLKLLQEKRRHLLRHLRRELAHFTPADSLVQLWLAAPDRGFLSVAVAPISFDQRHLIWPFPKGEVEPASDKAAPSRAFAKLSEALLRLGQRIKAEETCVDLGAAPGSWTYFAINHKARVIAVDRSPLREDLMRNPLIRFCPGDAFHFQPPARVDWLLCDVIAPPERTAELLVSWLREGWCRKFVVTLKLKGTASLAVLERLKRELSALASELFINRLTANKNEVCVFGAARSR